MSEEYSSGRQTAALSPQSLRLEDLARILSTFGPKPVTVAMLLRNTVLATALLRLGDVRGMPFLETVARRASGAWSAMKRSISRTSTAPSRSRRLQLDWQGKVVPSCVHCHQVGDAIRALYREQHKPIPMEWIYPMPAPETVGFALAPDRGGLQAFHDLAVLIPDARALGEDVGPRAAPIA